MSAINITLAMEQCTCWTCGIEFLAPKDWARNRIDDNKPIFCPRGHPNEYTWTTPPSETETKAVEEAKRLRAELAQRIHDHDQLEAKLIADGVVEPEEDPPAIEPEVVAKRKGLVCPKCSRPFKVARCFNKHLIRAHKMDPETLQPLT